MFLYLLLGVMNGPWKFFTVRKILPLLDLLAKFKRSKLLAARKAKQSKVFYQQSKAKFFISARARKKIAVHDMLANARKDHSSPLLLVPSIFMLKSPFPRKLNNVVLVCTLIPRPSKTSCKSLIFVSTYRVQISLPAALRLLWVLIIPNLLLLLCCVNGEIES